MKIEFRGQQFLLELDAWGNLTIYPLNPLCPDDIQHALLHELREFEAQVLRWFTEGGEQPQRPEQIRWLEG